MRHLLTIRDLSADDLKSILALSEGPYSHALAAQRRCALLREAERPDAKLDGAGGSAARRPSRIPAAERARHWRTGERRRRDAHPRLLPRDHRRPSVRPFSAATDGRAQRRSGSQHAVGERPSAAGTRRPADDQAIARPHRGCEHRLHRRGQQCCAFARGRLRTHSARTSALQVRQGSVLGGRCWV